MCHLPTHPPPITVDLGIDNKIKNIEETEAATQRLLEARRLKEEERRNRVDMFSEARC